MVGPEGFEPATKRLESPALTPELWAQQIDNTTGRRDLVRKLHFCGVAVLIAARLMNHIRVSHRKLFAFCRRCFEKLGLSATDARIVGENLIFANLRGVDSHGLIRMKIYADRLRAGGFKAKTRPKVISDQSSAALIDAGQG